MCCEAFCRGLCSILSSSAILVLDIVDVAVGAALLFSPLLWSSYVTAAPATVALPSYGACLVILSAVSLFGVGFRSNSGLLAAAVLAALCFVTEFTGGLIIASDPDFAAKLGLEIPTGWALVGAVASLRHAVRGASNGALGRARDAPPHEHRGLDPGRAVAARVEITPSRRRRLMCSPRRSQHRNKAKALELLARRVGRSA